MLCESCRSLKEQRREEDSAPSFAIAHSGGRPRLAWWSLLLAVAAPPDVLGAPFESSTRCRTQKKTEGGGFEPPETRRASTVFKTAAFNHSAIPPFWQSSVVERIHDERGGATITSVSSGCQRHYGRSEGEKSWRAMAR